MPQVASDASSVAASFSPPSPARSSPTTAPATPFEDMLDTVQAASDQPPPSSADRDDPPVADRPPADAPPRRSDAKTVAHKAKGSDDTKAGRADAKEAAAASDNGKPTPKTAKVAKVKVDGDNKAIVDDQGSAGKPSAVKTDTTAGTDVEPGHAPAVSLDPTALVAAAVTVASEPSAVDTTQTPAAAIAATVTVNLPDLAALKESLVKAGSNAKAQSAAKNSEAKTAAADAKTDGKPAEADPSAALKADAKVQNGMAAPDKAAPVHAQNEQSAQKSDTADVAANADAAAAKAANAAQPLTAVPPQIAAPQPVAAPTPQAAAVPVAGLAVEIASKALAGKTRFEIRLDPPELGRVDVRLDVDKSGQVTTHLTVDRADTLDLLRRDAAGLERALQDAGLKTSDNGLQFSLRDQGLSQQQQDTGFKPGAAQIVVEDDTLSATAAAQGYARYAGMGGGVDIRV